LSTTQFVRSTLANDTYSPVVLRTFRATVLIAMPELIRIDGTATAQVRRDPSSKRRLRFFRNRWPYVLLLLVLWGRSQLVLEHFGAEQDSVLRQLQPYPQLQYKVGTRVQSDGRSSSLRIGGLIAHTWRLVSLPCLSDSIWLACSTRRMPARAPRALLRRPRLSTTLALARQACRRCGWPSSTRRTLSSCASSSRTESTPTSPRLKGPAPRPGQIGKLHAANTDLLILHCGRLAVVIGWSKYAPSASDTISPTPSPGCWSAWATCLGRCGSCCGRYTMPSTRSWEA